MFYGIRTALTLICAICETKFINSIHKNISPKVANLTLLFLLFNSGMYFASAGIKLAIIIQDILLTMIYSIFAFFICYVHYNAIHS